MNSCIFCKIVKGEVPSRKVYEDEQALAFLDIKPVRPGHTLVITKEHFSDLRETTDEVLAHLAVVCKKVGLGVQNAVQAQGFNLSSNVGEAAGQDVFHTHFHIIPRKSESELSRWQHEEYQEGQAGEIAKLISKQIQ